MRTRLPLELCVVNIDGIDYYIDWGALKPECSFFLKTVATPKRVLRLLRKQSDKLGFELRASPRVEFGFYGVRVWRVA